MRLKLTFPTNRTLIINLTYFTFFPPPSSSFFRFNTPCFSTSWNWKNRTAALQTSAVKYFITLKKQPHFCHTFHYKWKRKTVLFIGYHIQWLLSNIAQCINAGSIHVPNKIKIKTVGSFDQVNLFWIAC